MEQKKLMDDLKSGIFQPAYLLHGEERYLISHYAKAIEDAVFPSKDTYKDVFDGSVPAHEIIMTAETLPFFADHRLVYVRDSKLFATGRKDDAEAIATYLSKIPQKTIIVFVEPEVDRRSKLFKQMAKDGCVIDCAPPTPQTLATWVAKLARKKNKAITPAVAQHFIRIVGTDMLNLSNEMDKLAAYAQNEITIQDIDTICTPTLESRIFELVKSVCTGHIEDALRRYRDMLILKESPIMILTMIIRQFRIILLSKCAKENGMTIIQTATEFGLRDFMVNEALSQGRRFTTDALINALDDCLDVDVKIKTGLVSPELGVEMLIIKYGNL